MTTPDITPPARPLVQFFDIAAVAMLAESWGWSAETAFVIAAQMAAAGVNAGQAARLFRDAARRVQ